MELSNKIYRLTNCISFELLNIIEKYVSPIVFFSYFDILTL